MAEQKAKLEPPAPLVFNGPYDQARQVTHNVSNISPKKIMVKVKCSDAACLQASPVFAVIEPGKSLPMMFQCKFADGKPNPAKNYMIGIAIADAPDALTNEVAKIKEAWTTIKDMTSLKIKCEFKGAGEGTPAPAATPPAETAPPVETPPAEGGGETPAEGGGEAPAQ